MDTSNKRLEYEDYDREVKKGPLDIAPELLFEMTEEGERMSVPKLS